MALMRDFKKIRKYGSNKSGIQNGDEEIFHRRIYLHIYFNQTRRAENDASFDADLIELGDNIEAGVTVDDLPKREQNKVAKYLNVKAHGDNVRVSFNEAACKETKKYHGYFAQVLNCEKNPYECLRKYRKRETIEEFFQSMKRRADGMRVRVWDTDTLRGCMFAQFVELCYYEYLSEESRSMKKLLWLKNGDHKHDEATNLELEDKLKCGLDNSPIYLVLQWFDTFENVKVSSKLVSRRWTTEVTSRDRMFLNKLGVTLPN
jgi:ribosomal protein L21E